MQVAKDIELPPEKREILPRVTQIRNLSQRRVILQLDDVEKLFDRQNKTSSALLNLMAGVQEQGFYVLASTNEPEQIDTSLLQPQRLGIVVYCPLPPEEARLHILEMHTPMLTPGEVALFPSADDRKLILEYIAKQTEGFPPRQLGKIATNAKSVLLERVALQRGRTRGLSEEDLNGATFEPDDWEEALYKTLQGFDIKAIRQRNEEIRNFVIHHQRVDLGFRTNATKALGSFEEVRKRLAARHSDSGISA